MPFVLAVLLSASLSMAQTPPAPAPAPAKAATNLSDHVRNDITRHRAMAAAHEAAARCLESGKAEEQCVKELQASCKGLGIGKYCGMRHEH
ncbi:MAG: hypothetical protein JNJ71_09295 [Rubrivivax sp.]|nr:hypothetical protein [Rubrivivax sp.]